LLEFINEQTKLSLAIEISTNISQYTDPSGFTEQYNIVITCHILYITIVGVNNSQINLPQDHKVYTINHSTSHDHIFWWDKL